MCAREIRPGKGRRFPPRTAWQSTASEPSPAPRRASLVDHPRPGSPHFAPPKSTTPLQSTHARNPHLSSRAHQNSAGPRSRARKRMAASPPRGEWDGSHATRRVERLRARLQGTRLVRRARFGFGAPRPHARASPSGGACKAETFREMLVAITDACYSSFACVLAFHVRPCLDGFPTDFCFVKTGSHFKQQVSLWEEAKSL